MIESAPGAKEAVSSNEGAVQDSLRKITRRLGDLGLPDTVVGDMPMDKHGYRRFTEKDSRKSTSV